MKRNWDELNLRDALPGMPEECHDALMKAAFSIEEEPKVKRFTMCTALIAALIIMATSAVALAATGVLGWSNFYQDFYGMTVPKAVEQAMQATEAQTFEVGELTYKVHQIAVDGHLALMSVEVYTTDGSEAIYCAEPYDTLGAYGDAVKEAERLGLDPMTTWVDAAKQKNLPLYRADAHLDVDYTLTDGEEMRGEMWTEEGHLIIFDMVQLNPNKVENSLDATYDFLGWKWNLDADADETDNVAWRLEEKTSLPVMGKIDEKTYKLEKELVLDGVTLSEVKAELYPTGAYLTEVFTAPEGWTDPESEETYERINSIRNFAKLTDKDGNSFGYSLSLSGGAIRTDQWPVFTIVQSIAVDELPEEMNLTFGGTTIVLK